MKRRKYTFSVCHLVAKREKNKKGKKYNQSITVKCDRNYFITLLLGKNIDAKRKWTRSILKEIKREDRGGLKREEKTNNHFACGMREKKTEK